MRLSAWRTRLPSRAMPSTRARRPSTSRCGTTSRPPSRRRSIANRPRRPPIAPLAWAPDERFRALAVLYAVESAQPAISRTKLAGLVEHYGFDGDDPAAEYFRLHAERRPRACAGRPRGAGRGAAGAAGELAAVAERALEANWRLLDGVERAGVGDSRRGLLGACSPASWRRREARRRARRGSRGRSRAAAGTRGRARRRPPARAAASRAGSTRRRSPGRSVRGRSRPAARAATGRARSRPPSG